MRSTSIVLSTLGLGVRVMIMCLFYQL